MNIKSKNKNIFWFKKLIIPFLIMGLFFILFKNTNAASPGHLLISQVQISGDKSVNDFVELFNPSSNAINLKNYKLVKRTQSGSKDISIKSWSREDDIFMAPGSYFLWASGGENSYPASIYADVFTVATIADNNGIALKRNDTGEIVDSVAWGQAQNGFAEGNVFPVNPKANQSMERKDKDSFPNAMDSNNNANDFFITSSHPRNSRSPYVKSEYTVPEAATPSPAISIMPTITSTITPFPIGYPSVTPTPEANFTPIPTIIITYPQDIRINELLPDPVGNDDEGEWIELYNNSDEDVDLAGWKIDDEVGKGSASFMIKDLIIKSFNYAVFPYKQTKITLNNGGGEVNLIAPDGKLLDNISYSKALLGESYNFSDKGWYWCKKITPANKNSVCESGGKTVDNSKKSDNINTNKKESGINSLINQPKDNSRETDEKSLAENIEDRETDERIESVEETDDALDSEESISTETVDAGELKNNSLSKKDSRSTAPLTASLSGNNGKGANIVPYILLTIGLGIVFALVSLRIKEFFSKKKKTPSAIDK